VYRKRKEEKHAFTATMSNMLQATRQLPVSNKQSLLIIGAILTADKKKLSENANHASPTFAL
jgi:hypothetical protein